jgi:plastocyanin
MARRHLTALAGAGILFAGASAGLLGVNSSHAATASASRPHKTMKIVEVNNKYKFAKAKLTVTKGTKVTWTNKTDAPHTVTGTKGWTFETKTFDQGKSVSFTFKKAGTYHYMCAVHPYMTAEVIVK